MRKSLLLALGCLLLCSVAARADSLYLFNGTLSTTSGNKAVTGTFTWSGSHITSWDLDFSALAGTCGYSCQLGGLYAVTTLGNGYVTVGTSADVNGTDANHNSYMSYDGGLTNTILANDGSANNTTGYDTQLAFDFNAIPGTFNTMGGNNAYAEFVEPSGNQNDYLWVGGSATLATPEPASVVFTLTGGLMLLAGFFWRERRKQALDNAA